MSKWISEPGYFAIRDRLLDSRDELARRFITTGEHTGAEIDEINNHLVTLLEQFANRWE